MDFDFDFNKALDSVTGAVSRYFDGQLFRDNPSAAAAFYSAQAGLQPNPSQAYQPQPGQIRLASDVNLLPILLIGGVIAAIIFIAK